jgi:hypothetical protein
MAQASALTGERVSTRLIPHAFAQIAQISAAVLAV